MRQSCRSHRIQSGIVRPETAMAIMSVLLRGFRERGEVEPRVAVLWLDRRHRLLDSFVVRADDADVEEVAEPVLRARGSPVGAVVLGSWLPEGRRQPTKADRRRFAEMQRRHADAGIELLDWYVLGERRCWSMAEEVIRMGGQPAASSRRRDGRCPVRTRAGTRRCTRRPRGRASSTAPTRLPW